MQADAYDVHGNRRLEQAIIALGLVLHSIAAAGASATPVASLHGQSFVEQGAEDRFSDLLKKIKTSIVPDLVGQQRWAELAEVHRGHIEGADSHHGFATAVNALFAQTDLSHLRYYFEDDYEYWLFGHMARTGRDLATEHVGIVARSRQGKWFVRGILEGSPAAELSIGAGDELLSVDGQPYHPILSFRSKAGTKVVIELRRNTSERYTVDVVPVREALHEAWSRANVASITKMPVGEYEVAYAHIWSMFDGKEYAELSALQHEVDGLILDFREGFGGQTGHASQFLIGKDSSDARRWLRPTVILTSSDGTRSAKEIITAQAKARHRATVVGTPTAGAVLPSRFLRIGGDGLLVAPTSWYPLEGQPVTPDYPVECSSLYCGDTDEQLDKAKSVLLEQMQARPSARTPPRAEEAHRSLSIHLENYRPQALHELPLRHFQASVHLKIVRDIDGDGAEELILPSWDGGIDMLASNGMVTRMLEFHTQYGESISACEPIQAGEAIHWLVAWTTYGMMGERSRPKVALYSTDNSVMWIYEPDIPDGVGAEARLASADLDLDGKPEIIVGLKTYEQEQLGDRSFRFVNHEAHIVILDLSGKRLAQRRFPGGLDILHIGHFVEPDQRPVIICGWHQGLHRFTYDPSRAAPIVEP